MPAGTKTAPKADVLAELERLEEIVAGLRAKASAAAAEHRTALTRAQELHGQRQHLAVREPGLTDHTGAPNAGVEDNPIRLIDKELANLPDLADLQARYDHAKRLVDRAHQDVRDHVTENLGEVFEALDPLGRQRAAEINEALRVAADLTATLIGHCQRLAGLAALAGQDTRVRGADDASALARELGRWSISPPEIGR